MNFDNFLHVAVVESDTETNLYFLKTRYYDPTVCRFINADEVSYLDPETINGLNLFSYCGNNPVMRTDSTGTAWWHWLVGALVIVGLAVLVVCTAGIAGVGIGAAFAAGFAGAGIGTGIAGAAVTIAAGAFAGAVIGAATGLVLGAVTGGIGAAISGGNVWQGMLNGAGQGFMMGAITGAITGGIKGGFNYASYTRSTVVVDGQRVPVYRGGNDMTVRPGEYKMGTVNGQPSIRGISTNTNPLDPNVVKYGGAYRITNVPKGLSFNLTSGTHYELVTKTLIAPEKYQALLNVIKLIKW